MANTSEQQLPLTAEKPELFDHRKALKGLVLGVFAIRAVEGKGIDRSEKLAQKVMAKDSTVLERLVSPETIATIETIVHQTEYWHGTGRYQYRGTEVVDIFRKMLDEAALTPHRDDLDIVGPMDSISFARNRTYARAYADMHENGEKGERHGSALLWSAAFIGPLALEIIQEEKMWRPKNWKRVRRHFDNSNSADWYKKVRQQPTGTLGIFAYGSDIEGNYPILFGVKENIVKPARTSKSIALHEVRSIEPVGFNSITHIEVPESKVAEVKAMVGNAGLDTPVLAIEDFEAYAAKQTFKQLVTTP